MEAALLPVDLVTLLFTAGIVVLVVSTLVMLLEMMPRRHRGPHRQAGHHPRVHGRHHRGNQPTVPYGGIPLSPTAAQVLSVAQQRAGAKQAGLEPSLGVVGPSPVASSLMPSPSAQPMLEPLGPRIALAAPGPDVAPPPIALGPISHEPATQEPMVIEVEPRSEPRRAVRHLAPGEVPTTDMVMELLQELAEREPERLVQIIQQWLRSDRRRFVEDDES